jgi:hypothetical protein
MASVIFFVNSVMLPVRYLHELQAWQRTSLHAQHCHHEIITAMAARQRRTRNGEQPKPGLTRMLSVSVQINTVRQEHSMGIPAS